MKLCARGALLTAAIVGIGAGTEVTAASVASSLPPSTWDAGIANAVSADVVASTSLPDGHQVYVFGDTLGVNGTVICSPSSCPYGYPHDSVAIEAPGSASFAMQSCLAFGCSYGWQWVPNWSDGSYFWMAAPAVYGSSLYVVGMRTTTSGTGCSFGCSEGEYVARFAIGPGDALSYQGITQLTGAAGQSGWGSAVADSSAGGWWLTGTRNTGSSGCLTDCKTMDAAFVPYTGILDPSKWSVTLDVLTSGHGWDLGTVASLAHAGAGWVIFTKQNDIIGSAIEELDSANVTSGWSRTGTYPVSPASNCTLTYSAQAHPGDGAPAGEMLVSWASNGNATGKTCAYVPQFAYLPVNVAAFVGVPSAEAAATFSPASVAFGDVPKGGEVVQYVTVTNEGPGALAIDGLQPITGPDAADFSSFAGCNTPPGQSCQVRVTFGPQSVGSATASLTLQTSAGPLGPIALTGTGTPNPVTHSLTLGDLRLAFKTPAVGACLVRNGRSAVKLVFSLTARKLHHGTQTKFDQAVFWVRTHLKHGSKTAKHLPASYVFKLGGTTQGNYRVKLTVTVTETVGGAPKTVTKTITAQFPLCPAF